MSTPDKTLKFPPRAADLIPLHSPLYISINLIENIHLTTFLRRHAQHLFSKFIYCFALETNSRDKTLLHYDSCAFALPNIPYFLVNIKNYIWLYLTDGDMATLMKLMSHRDTLFSRTSLS